MKEDKIKRLEAITMQLLTSYFISDLKELEFDFGIINITGIKISSDLSYLDIMVSSFKNKELLTKKLAEYAQMLKKKLNKDLDLRKIPIIRFRYDLSGETAQVITNAINNLK